MTPVSSSNTATWTVTTSTGSGSGTLGLNMVNSTGVRGADSQAVTNLPFTGAADTVDRTAPAAQSIVRAGTFRATSGGGVTVTSSSTAAAELMFTGTAANLARRRGPRPPQTTPIDLRTPPWWRLSVAMALQPCPGVS